MPVAEGLRYYKAKLLMEQQRTKSARKALRTAYRLDPENISYQNALDHFSEGKVRRPPLTKRTTSANLNSSLQAILNQTNTGIYHSKTGNHSQSRHAFEKAWRLANRQTETNDTLMSILINNMACARLMDQAVCHNRAAEASPHLSIHIGIIHCIGAELSQALQYHPGNTTAYQNLQQLYQSLDSLDQPGFVKFMAAVHSTAQSTTERQANSESRSGISDPPSVNDIPRKVVSGPYKDLIDFVNGYDEVVLLIDNSVSMEKNVGYDGPSRFQTMREIVKAILLFSDDRVKMGAMSVSGNHCSEAPDFVFPPENESKNTLLEALMNLKIRGKTPLDLRMRQAVGLFKGGINSRRMMLLCSDGLNTCNGFNTCEIAASIRQQGIDVHVLSLLEDNNKYYREFAVYDCITEDGAGRLWKIDPSGQIDQIETRIPVMLYPVLLPASIKKMTCLGPSYHHTYSVELPAALVPDKENGWVVR